MTNNNSILVFGGGELQFSIIRQCREMNLFTVVIDPNPNAEGQKTADAFEEVAGNDFEKTCEVVEKYSIGAIVTAATDKTLEMMAQVAEKYDFPFFSQSTARNSTDKFLMKQVFQKNNIPCAKGTLETGIKDSYKYPIILKPRDNSGSRGIIRCENKKEAEDNIAAVFSYSKKQDILVEEFLTGQEFSVESLHFGGQTKILQITEKRTTPFPYNVELAHIQPADLSSENEEKISLLIKKIAFALDFQNCASHTELKINDDGIFIIETSPRLGGDFITSQLVPLSTGINMEKALIEIAFGKEPDLNIAFEKASGIFYFDFDIKNIRDTDFIDVIKQSKGVVDVDFKLKTGMIIPKIKNSLDRYGHIILNSDNRTSLLELADCYLDKIKSVIF